MTKHKCKHKKADGGSAWKEIASIIHPQFHLAAWCSLCGCLHEMKYIFSVNGTPHKCADRYYYPKGVQQ